MNATDSLLAILRAAPNRTFMELPANLLAEPAQPGAKQETALGEAVAIASSEGMAFGPLVGTTIKKFSRRKS